MKVYAVQVRPRKEWFPIVSWLIMTVQGMAPWSKQSYSHYALMYSMGPDHEMIIDSTGVDGITITHSKNFWKKYKLVKMKELPPPMTAHLFNIWVKRIIGRKYDFLQIGGVLLRVMGVISFNKAGKNYQRMICSEVILNYLEKFNGMNFGDPDNYGLLMVSDVIDSL